MRTLSRIRIPNLLITIFTSKMDLFSILDGTPEPPIVDLHLDSINDSGEYNLPTPMFEFQKELTDQIVSLHYSDILKYCETNDTTELIVKSLEICVDNCMLVATHPYLLIQHYMPKNLALRDIPAKLAETSGKFNVIKDLINVILMNNVLNIPKNVGIVMKNDSKFFDLTEALLLGCAGPKTIQRYVGNNVKKETGRSSKARDSRSTTVHLIPHDGVLNKHETEFKNVKFDVLVAMDGYVDTHSAFFQNLRRQNRRGDEAVLIRLIPINTIEHCLLHYEANKNDSNYLYKLISSIVCLRDQIGNLPPDIFPIYNQNLTYLSHTFFDHVFRRDLRSFPSWPLPELSNIPRFSATDVERSLLTEVVYHYTPYDSNENSTEFITKKKSYYETKRLQLDYVTNPLKNDYNTLSGIQSHHGVSAKPSKGHAILTHKIILELNTSYLTLATVEEEYNSYVEFNRDERQKKFGRRIEEVKQALSKILDDVDHAQHRIEITEKKISKRNQEVEELEQRAKEIKERLLNFTESHGLPSSSLKGQFVSNQLKIWELQKEVKALVDKLHSKREERSYTTTEVSNCDKSISTSKEQLTQINGSIDIFKRKIEEVNTLEEQADENSKKQRKALEATISKVAKENEALKAKLAKSLKFLKETSHLKKRKGRGLTPNTR